MCSWLRSLSWKRADRHQTPIRCISFCLFTIKQCLLTSIHLTSMSQRSFILWYKSVRLTRLSSLYCLQRSVCLKQRHHHRAWQPTGTHIDRSTSLLTERPIIRARRQLFRVLPRHFFCLMKTNGHCYGERGKKESARERVSEQASCTGGVCVWGGC